MGEASSRKVAYYYDPEIGNIYYGSGHPMKPHRVRMAHALILRYGLYNHLESFQPVLAPEELLAQFHTKDYVSFLKQVTPHNKGTFGAEIKQYAIAQDCPIFEGMFEYCQRYTGGSVGGAARLNHGMSDVVINWSGGLHHAKKSEASGFCYVNDVVLSILELLKYHHRVLYIDIDVHHGDGVEEAFLTTDRVMTVSFHKHGDNFFPGSGDITDIGVGPGKYYCVNVPLKDGMATSPICFFFKPIMNKIMETYQPGAIVLQSGADSLAQDKLGVFNLSIKGHATCHRHLASFGVPLLVLGGGGYKIKNVARCWTYETGVLLGREELMQDAIPPNEYFEDFGPDYSLHIKVDSGLANHNKREALEKLRNQVFENLKHVTPVGAPFQERLPDLVETDSLKTTKKRHKLVGTLDSADGTGKAH